MLEIVLKEATGFLGSFATLIGSTVEKGRVNIPAGKGKGYMQGYLLGNTIGLMIRNYELNEDLISRRMANPNSNERIVLSFNNAFPSKDDTASLSERSTIKNLPSVQIGKGNMDVELFYPSKMKFRSILISIETSALQGLLGPNEGNSIVNTITSTNQPLLFEELISPQLQKVALEITEAGVPDALQNFYMKIKAEELICLLFAELLKRENTTVHALNELDVQKIYQIREMMLSSLDTPPVLMELANKAGMSESKLKRLFKQIFGNSIFNYYQSFRMKEAAHLIKERKLSVSEVGYKMGFTNLSHFSKMFEAHIGMKPKKYSTSA